MLASNKPALTVAGVAIGVIRRLAKFGYGSSDLVPAQHPVVWNVAPQQETPVAEIDRTLAPARSGMEPLHARERQVIFDEAFMECRDRGVRIAQAFRPA